MAYTDIDNPSETAFNTVLYTGTGSGGSNRQITGVGFQPNFTWVKTRGSSQEHVLVDSVRGATKALDSTSAGAEETNDTRIGAFISDGFQLGSGSVQNRVNHNATTIVSWNWLAETSFTNDASGTGIGTIDSAGSVNDTNGFSIVSYTGTGSNGTIKHGLSTVPKMIIVKDIDSGSYSWHVYHVGIGNTKTIYLDINNAPDTDSIYWNNTTPTSSVFSVGTSVTTNNNTDAFIAYCFADVQGYSKFGSYDGNSTGNDNNFQYCGFSPAWVMIKCDSAAESWVIFDTKRNGFNPDNDELYADLTGAETSTEAVDFLSNGFNPYKGTGTVNRSGKSYIFMAFAEHPFVTSTGVPATAK